MKIFKYLIILFILAILFNIRSKSYYPFQVNVSKLYQTDQAYLSQWMIYDGLYEKSDIDAAKELCATKMNIHEDDSAYLKVEKIGTFLYKNLHSSLGSPNKILFNQSPWENYLTIAAGKSQFYCTQFSAMFAFFCRINNLSSREIETKGYNDRHIFNETYLPESKEWVYTDLTQSIIYAKDHSGFLNVNEVYEGIYSKENIEGDSCLTLEKGDFFNKHLSLFSSQLKFFFDEEVSFYYYIKADLNKTQKPVQKIKSYLLNKPYYYVFSNVYFFKYWIVVKYFLILILLVTMFSLLPFRNKK